MATLSVGNYTFNYNGGEGSQIDRTNGFPDGTNDYPLNFEAEGESYTKITIGRNGNRHWVTVGPYAQEYDLDDAIVYDDTLDGKTITVTEEQSVDSALKSFFDNYTDYSALPAPKAVSLDNLQTFKGKCDETYAPMSRALPAPAGTTDAGKVPTVNSAGNGYTLQTPSGGGKQLYQHNLRVHNDDYSIVLTFTIINDTNVEMSYSDIVQFLETITGTYGSYTYPCSGICQGMPTGTAPVTGIDCGLSTGNIIYHFVKDNSQFADSLLSNHANIIDIIIPL